MGFQQGRYLQSPIFEYKTGLLTTGSRYAIDFYHEEEET